MVRTARGLDCQCVQRSMAYGPLSGAFRPAAAALRISQSALGAYFRRLCARIDKAKAVTAAAHKLARMVYFTLTRGEEFVDQGQEKYEQQQRQRSDAALKHRAAALGFVITPTASAT